MPSFIAAAAIASTAGKMMAASDAEDAALAASRAQMNSADLAIEKQKDAYTQLRETTDPYTNVGTNAINSQADLLGLNGKINQTQALDYLSGSPIYQAMLKSGQEAILQNAAATGGLRGGNVQAALAQFSPQMLSQLINDQFSRLGTLSTLGQNTALNAGQLGINSASNIGNLLTGKGAAEAGGLLAASKARGQGYSAIGEGLSMYSGQGKTV